MEPPPLVITLWAPTIQSIVKPLEVWSNTGIGALNMDKEASFLLKALKIQLGRLVKFLRQLTEKALSLFPLVLCTSHTHPLRAC